MNRAEFDMLVAEEFPAAIPEKFRGMIKNVAFLSEAEPSDEVRREEGLSADETLLGLYRGVPRSARGDYYGVGPVVPDIIILYREPIHEEAKMRAEDGEARTLGEALRAVVRETIWHEVAHFLGIGEKEVRAREALRESKREADAADVPGDTMRELLPSAFGRRDEAPYQSELDPIEVEKESPEVQKALHEPLVPASQNHASIDEEGGGDGVKEWWESKKPEKPEGLLPENVPPLSRPDMPDNAGSPPKRGEPPDNLPKYEK